MCSGSVRAIVDPDFADRIFAGPLSKKFDKLGSNFELVQDRVTRVDTEQKTVQLKQGDPIKYDYRRCPPPLLHPYGLC